jgi:hypothetical protein
MLDQLFFLPVVKYSQVCSQKAIGKAQYRVYSPAVMSTDQMFFALTLLSSAFSIRASPVSSPDLLPHLYPRAGPCSPGGTPILYKEYHADLCPPTNSMDSDGLCPATFANYCKAYCEVRTTFTYGVEQPLDNPYCHGPLTCSVGTNKATTYTWTGSVNPSWLDALGLGITGGYSSATMTTDVRSTSVNLGDGQCGYFSFLPILHDSW